MPDPRVDELGAVARLDTVAVALASARDGVDALLRDRGLRRTTPATTAESLLRGAVASAQLAGSTSSHDDVRAGRADPVAQRAVRLNASLLELVPVVSRSPLQALARMHALASAGSVPQEQVGRPRPDLGAAVSLQRLSVRLLAPTTAPAIAVAAIAHADLAVAAPFASDNDLVARALERLVLVARGVDPVSALVPEAGHRALADRYGAALNAYRTGGSAGARVWLLYATTALGEAVVASPLAERRT